MDTISIVMYAFIFALSIIFTMLAASGFAGVSNDKRKYEPIDLIWNFAAMLCWFSFAFINVAFATEGMFIAFTYLFIGLGFLFLVLFFYGLFLLIHVSSQVQLENEMKLD